MKTFVGALVGLLVLSFSAPVVLAQDASAEETTSDIRFYGHIFGTSRTNPMPANTQFPYGEADLSQGATAHSCNTVPGEVTCDDDGRNEVWLYSTAGFVQIKQYEEFDYGLLHNERGLTKDTYLDTNKDITATFYMSADYHGWLLTLCTPGTPRDFPWPVPCWNWDPGVLQGWQVQATIFTGVLGEYGGEANTAPDIQTAVEAGKLTKIAEGVSQVQDIKSLEPAGNPTVWKFDVNLGKPLRDKIPKEESYLIRYKWWSVKPDGQKRIVPELDTWNVNSGEFYPPVVHLPVKGAFNVEYVIPQFVYEKLVVLGVMNTPWGSYDVDQDSITISVKDAKGTTFEPRRISRLADFSVAHGGHYKPVNVTYVWDFKQDKLPPGDYTVTIAATNFQGSASAACSAKFTVLAGGHGGPVEAGQCGVRTITDDQLSKIKEGSAGDATTQGGGASEDATGLPTLVPPLAIGAVPLLAQLRRRWAK